MRHTTIAMVLISLALALALTPEVRAELGTETETVTELKPKQKWKKVEAATLDILRFTKESHAFAYVELGGANATVPLTFRADLETECLPLPGGSGGTVRERITVVVDPDVHPRRGVSPIIIPGSEARACFSTVAIKGRTARTVIKKVDFLDGPPILSSGITRIDETSCGAAGTSCREGVQCCSGLCGADSYECL